MRAVQPIALLAFIASAPAIAQSAQLSSAIGTGEVGERYDGYMGFAAVPADLVRRQVIAINIKRRSLYSGIAAQRGVTVDLVGLTTACVVFRDLPVGEAYLLDDKVWRRRAPGAPAPRPDHCR